MHARMTRLETIARLSFADFSDLDTASPARKKPFFLVILAGMAAASVVLAGILSGLLAVG